MGWGFFDASANALRSADMERVRTSSVTKVSVHTFRIRTSLETTSPASARHTKTCMIFGSRRTVLPWQARLLSLGTTSQLPSWKSPCKGELHAKHNHCTFFPAE